VNTDVAQLCKVLRSLLGAAKAGKISKEDYAMCEALLSALESKYEAGVAALDANLAEQAAAITEV